MRQTPPGKAGLPFDSSSDKSDKFGATQAVSPCLLLVYITASEDRKANLFIFLHPLYSSIEIDTNNQRRRCASGAGKSNEQTGALFAAERVARKEGGMLIRRIFTTGILLFVVAHRQASAAPPELTVKKTQIMNSRDEPVRLRGVNAASLEWTSDGEGHILDTVKTAINDWHVNVIRLPLAQDRWFGKAREQKDEGKAYRGARQAGRRPLCRAGLLHHPGPALVGRGRVGQADRPARDARPEQRGVLEELRHSVQESSRRDLRPVQRAARRELGRLAEGRPGHARRPIGGTRQKTYEAVGMQALLDTVRATGAKNVVIVGRPGLVVRHVGLSPGQAACRSRR